MEGAYTSRTVEDTRINHLGRSSSANTIRVVPAVLVLASAKSRGLILDGKVMGLAGLRAG